MSNSCSSFSLEGVSESAPWNECPTKRHLVSSQYMALAAIIAAMKCWHRCAFLVLITALRVEILGCKRNVADNGLEDLWGISDSGTAVFRV